MLEAPRLFYLDDIPTPYRLGVQRLAARRWPGAFRLAFCAKSEPGRDWKLSFDGLDAEILDGHQVRPPSQVNPFSFKWNPGIRRSLAAFRPDIVVMSGYVHPTMMCAARWCVSHDVPYAVVCETSCRNSACSGWRWTTKLLVAGWLARNMAFGLPVGEEAADYLRRLGAADAPMHFFPNTPDTSRYIAAAEMMTDPAAEVAVRQRFEIPPSRDIFLFVGRLIDAKQPTDAVHAYNKMRLKDSSCLVVVGDGPLMAELRSTAAGDPNVIFAGWLAEPDAIASLMAIASALVLPSRHEPWGAVVNEAMAAGAPVIASDRVGAAVELIEHEINGCVIPAGDIAGFAAAMDFVAENRERRHRMSISAQAQADRYGEEFAAGNLIRGAIASTQ